MISSFINSLFCASLVFSVVSECVRIHIGWVYFWDWNLAHPAEYRNSRRITRYLLDCVSVLNTLYSRSVHGIYSPEKTCFSSFRCVCVRLAMCSSRLVWQILERHARWRRTAAIGHRHRSSREWRNYYYNCDGKRGRKFVIEIWGDFFGCLTDGERESPWLDGGNARPESALTSQCYLLDENVRRFDHDNLYLSAFAACGGASGCCHSRSTHRPFPFSCLSPELCPLFSVHDPVLCYVCTFSMQGRNYCSPVGSRMTCDIFGSFVQGSFHPSPWLFPPRVCVCAWARMHSAIIAQMRLNIHEHAQKERTNTIHRVRLCEA